MGRLRALETRGASFSAHRNCHILRRARQAYTAPCHNSRGGGRGGAPHIATAHHRKRVRRFKNTAGLYAAKSLNTAAYLTVNNRHVNQRALISKKLHRNGAVKKAACERIRMRTGFWCTCLRVFLSIFGPLGCFESKTGDGNL